jgi:hypothetical protein
MQHIVDWLRKLGMSEYAERFVKNRIDFSVLRDLTDQDLKDLGVALGDRRKMRRAIAELDDALAAAAPAAGMEPQLRDAAERRQVTVMFSDLVGSTALSAQMDPEDLTVIGGMAAQNQQSDVAQPLNINKKDRANGGLYA